MTHHNKLKQH